MYGDIGKLTLEGIRARQCWRSQRVLSAAADNTSLDLHNSSDDTQLHSIMLWSHQASQQTNSGCVHDQPGLPVPEGSFMWDFWMQLCVHLCIYITAFASISSTALEIEALSFAVNWFRKKNRRALSTQIKCDVQHRQSPGEILFRIESHVFASEEYHCKWNRKHFRELKR